jgi:hypothetical protein
VCGHQGSFKDQFPFASSSSGGQCRAGTTFLDAQNSELVPNDQTDFQHLGSGEAFMPALPAPDIKACSSNKAPLLGRTGNDFDSFRSTSQKQSGWNCSAKTVAASSLQPPLVEVKSCNSHCPFIFLATQSDIFREMIMHSLRSLVSRV